jgi:uncharacterized FAD-dependent dehydrogenase
MSQIFDVAIIGGGVAGAFAIYRISQQYKGIKCILFDIGRPPQKRRRQCEGWMGCLPNSDGKIYLSDVNKLSSLITNRKAKTAYTYFDSILSNINEFKVTRDRSPTITIEKKLKNIGYEISLNDYIQIYPKDIHALSKYLSLKLEQNSNLSFVFDTEVNKIYKKKDLFTIIAENNEFKCKNIILATGRSGWRWARNIFSDFDIIDNNDIARFGVRIEMNASIMKDFNRSQCTLKKNDDVEIGPISWFGTIIPEDHMDMAISAFRSNEERWKSDKVSFSLIGSRQFASSGFEQTDRIGKLTFIMANDRIIKEKVSHILSKKSKISIIPEYNWIRETIADLASVVPDIASKAYFHIPTIMPFAPKINISENMSTDVEGLYVAGENAGIHGILAAALMGIVSADSICKRG